jgi:hypothetical protein
MPLYLPPIQFVTTLPSTTGLMDGYEVGLVVDATNGVVWRMKYRAADASTSKWQFIGGPPMISEIATNETIAVTTYAALTTAGPSIALPRAGDYIVSLGAEMNVNSAAVGSAFMSYDIGATVAVDADAVSVSNTFVQFERIIQESARTMRKDGLTAVTLTAKYRVTTGSAAIAKRWMAVHPVRLA